MFPNTVKLFQNHAEDLTEAMPITKLELSHCERFLASISHDDTIKFYDLNDILTIAENQSGIIDGQQIETEK